MNYSPLAIEMLLYFQTRATKYRGTDPVTWPPAQTAILQQFLAQGLVEPSEYGYSTTPAGEILVRKLRLHFEVLMLDHPMASAQE